MPSSEKPPATKKTDSKGPAKAGALPSSPMDSLKDAYFSIEDKYYELMDYLEDKVHLPVYKAFVEPIERKGVPSFPIATLLILLLFGGGVFLLTGTGQTGEVTINLSSQSGVAVNDATVTLYLGPEVEGNVLKTALSKNGRVVFSSVPIGTELSIKVTAKNYSTYTGSLGTISKENANPVSIRLVEVVLPGEVFTVTVLDDATGKQLSGALVVASSLGVNFQKKTTNSIGVVRFELKNRDPFVISVSKTDYSSYDDYYIDPSDSLSATIRLKTPSKCSGSECDKKVQAKVTLIVKVSNALGEPVIAQVTMSNSGGSLLGTRKTSAGQVAFENVSTGSAVYFYVKATDADLRKYEAYTSPSEYIVPSEDAIRSIELTTATSSSALEPVFFEVRDDSNKLLSGAEIRVYNKDSGAFLDRCVSSFGVCNITIVNITAYASAYLKSYLPDTLSNLKPGTLGVFTLKKILPGSVGTIDVQVLESDGTTNAASASVWLLNNNSNRAGYPDASTNADGKVTLTNIALKMDYYVVAQKLSKKGQSTYTVRASDINASSVVVKFEPTTAIIAVSVKDVINSSNLVGNVIAFGDDMPKNITCTADSSNSYSCKVRADSKVYIEVSSSGYETRTSNAFVLSTGSSKDYTVFLLSSKLKDQFFVKLIGIYDDADKNLTLIDNGRNYYAKFIINIPSMGASSKSGMMVRVGTSGKEGLSASDSKEKFVIIKDGTSDNSPAPIFASAYLPSTSCSNDLKANNELGYFKWVSYDFSDTSGSKEISVRLLTKPDATTTDKLQVFYNGWYSPSGANDSYIRSPVDTVFNSLLRTSSRDWCYAGSSKNEYSIAIGRSTCTSSACISLDFSDGNANYGASYLATIAKPLIAKAEIRLLKQVTSPRLFVKSDGGAMQIINYSIVTDAEKKVSSSADKSLSNTTIQLLPFSEPAALSFYLLPVMPVSSGIFSITFYNGATELVSAKGYVTIEGDGTMKIVYVKPDKVNSTETTDLSIKVADAVTGKAITDATISILENTGTPFSENPPEPVSGGALFEDNQGYNGVYNFDEILPTEAGTFDVLVESSNYASQKQIVPVLGKDFLSVSPNYIEACGLEDYRTIRIRNSLDLNLTVYATSSCALMVNYSYSLEPWDGVSGTGSFQQATSTVVYDSFLTNNYKFVLPNRRLGMFTVKPAANDKECSIVFNAEALDKSRAIQSISYSSCDIKTINDFLSVSPSKIIYTSSEGNCDSESTITVANTLPTDVQGEVSLTLTGPGLAIKTTEGTTSLETGYKTTIARSASNDFAIVPTVKNKTLALQVSAVAGPRTKTVSVEVKNCFGTIETVAPKILSYYPATDAPIDYQPFNILLTTDKAAICTLNSVYTFPIGLNPMVHQMGMSLNGGTDTPPLVEGYNMFYASCCGLTENGGKCSTETKLISFKFALKATPTAVPTTTPTNCDVSLCGSDGKKCNSDCEPLDDTDDDDTDDTDDDDTDDTGDKSSCTSYIGDDCKTGSTPCCKTGVCKNSKCVASTEVGYGELCSSDSKYSTQTCKFPLKCANVRITNNPDLAGTCVCNTKVPEGANGCPEEARYCVDIGDDAMDGNGLCSEKKSISDTSPCIDCKQPDICTADEKCEKWTAPVTPVENQKPVSCTKSNEKEVCVGETPVCNIQKSQCECTTVPSSCLNGKTCSNGVCSKGGSPAALEICDGQTCGAGYHCNQAGIYGPTCTRNKDDALCLSSATTSKSQVSGSRVDGGIGVLYVENGKNVCSTAGGSCLIAMTGIDLSNYDLPDTPLGSSFSCVVPTSGTYGSTTGICSSKTGARVCSECNPSRSACIVSSCNINAIPDDPLCLYEGEKLAACAAYCIKDQDCFENYLCEWNGKPLHSLSFNSFGLCLKKKSGSVAPASPSTGLATGSLSFSGKSSVSFAGDAKKLGAPCTDDSQCETMTIDDAVIDEKPVTQSIKLVCNKLGFTNGVCSSPVNKPCVQQAGSTLCSVSGGNRDGQVCTVITGLLGFSSACTCNPNIKVSYEYDTNTGKYTKTVLPHDANGCPVDAPFCVTGSITRNGPVCSTVSGNLDDPFILSIMPRRECNAVYGEKYVASATDSLMCKPMELLSSESKGNFASSSGTDTDSSGTGGTTTGSTAGGFLKYETLVKDNIAKNAYDAFIAKPIVEITVKKDGLYCDNVLCTAASLSPAYIGVSSIVPIGAFLMHFTVDADVMDESMKLVSSTTSVVSAYLYSNGAFSPAGDVNFKAVKEVYLLITYPGADAESISEKYTYSTTPVNCLQRLSYDPTCKSCTPSVTFSFTGGFNGVAVQPVKIVTIDTDKYTFAAGLFNNYEKMFVPFDKDNPENYDPYDATPALQAKLKETYSQYLYSNIQLEFDKTNYPFKVDNNFLVELTKLSPEGAIAGFDYGFKSISRTTSEFYTPIKLSFADSCTTGPCTTGILPSTFVAHDIDLVKVRDMINTALTPVTNLKANLNVDDKFKSAIDKQLGLRTTRPFGEVRISGVDPSDNALKIFAIQYLEDTLVDITGTFEYSLETSSAGLIPGTEENKKFLVTAPGKKRQDSYGDTDIKMSLSLYSPSNNNYWIYSGKYTTPISSTCSLRASGFVRYQNGEVPIIAKVADIRNAAKCSQKAGASVYDEYKGILVPLTTPGDAATKAIDDCSKDPGCKRCFFGVECPYSTPNEIDGDKSADADLKLKECVKGNNPIPSDFFYSPFTLINPELKCFFSEANWDGDNKGTCALCSIGNTCGVENCDEPEKFSTSYVHSAQCTPCSAAGCKLTTPDSNICKKLKPVTSAAASSSASTSSSSSPSTTTSGYKVCYKSGTQYTECYQAEIRSSCTGLYFTNACHYISKSSSCTERTGCCDIDGVFNQALIKNNDSPITSCSSLS
ncbi:MAG: carboxypeptidase-like regulatory domain-containing protein [Candidatus Micrarchaeia archaeon]|jgi:hypothetical protein